MLTDNYVVVIGAINLDIAGLSESLYREKDSNIGKIKMTIGGVGQNIAQNLVKLDVPTYLITVYGDDFFGGFLADECKKYNICLDYAKCILNSRSATYLYVTDDHGDMVAAVNDMKIIDNITPEFLESRINFINRASICVIDGNIPKDSIEWLANHCTVPIFVDPVSVAKVNRFENILYKIDTFKPNALEASALSGVKIFDNESAKKAAKVLHEKGVKNVFISLGEKGILCSKEGEVDCIPIIPTHVVSANGAGDCSMATITWARFQYDNTVPLTRVGILTQAAASLTVEVEQSVSPNLNIKNVIERLKEFLGEV